MQKMNYQHSENEVMPNLKWHSSCSLHKNEDIKRPNSVYFHHKNSLPLFRSYQAADCSVVALSNPALLTTPGIIVT